MKKYDYIHDFDKDGFAIVELNGKKGFINRQGEEIVSPIYDKVWGFRGDNFATVTKDDKWGLINKKGRVVVELKYEYVDYIEKGIVEVTLNGKNGLIDENGKFYPFIEGCKLRRENNTLYYVKFKNEFIYRIGGFTGNRNEFIRLLRKQLRGRYEYEIYEYIRYIDNIQ